jgi:hypothetical protein
VLSRQGTGEKPSGFRDPGVAADGASSSSRAIPSPLPPRKRATAHGGESFLELPGLEINEQQLSKHAAAPLTWGL